MAETELKRLFKKCCGEEAISIAGIPGTGSNRQYFRITGTSKSAVGVYNEDVKENEAFLSFTRTFLSQGIPVPGILAEGTSKRMYLLQDLGEETLYSRLSALREGMKGFPSEAEQLYLRAVKWLPQLQVRAGESIDYTKCYPRDAFDQRSMLWDLNYFKYYFLKLAKIPFDEQALEEDFHGLAEILMQSGARYFMYRDFQSRNIMILNDEPWFIDYQGGRKGALQYDIASLLYDAKADITDEARVRLLNHYLDALSALIPVNRDKFVSEFYNFALIRILQALGAYGFRGYYENKPHFLQSIPFALKNLRVLRESGRLDPGLPALMQVIDSLAENQAFMPAGDHRSPLRVTIRSFSYRHGIPVDHSGHGGGFVFDCRALPNPGRYEEYQALTGKDQPVIDYLKREHAVDEFLIHATSLVDQSVRTYMARGFEHLSVSFGCTGGQHRSVYCAEELASHLRAKFNILPDVKHLNIL
jgi:aminoglycoside/choline kinase family phosphotransferase